MPPTNHRSAGSPARTGTVCWVLVAIGAMLAACIVMGVSLNTVPGAGMGGASPRAAADTLAQSPWSLRLALRVTDGLPSAANACPGVCPWWTAWTFAWVHWTPTHLLHNLMAGIVVAWFGWSARVRRRDSLAWVLSWPLSAWALRAGAQAHDWAPALSTGPQGGLSGLWHAGVAVAALSLVLASRPDAAQRRAHAGIGLLVLLGLAAKLGLEVWSGPVSLQGSGTPGLPSALITAPGMHVAGALAGLAASLGVRLVLHERWRGASAGRTPAGP
jgi:hypothetical protein